MTSLEPSSRAACCSRRSLPCTCIKESPVGLCVMVAAFHGQRRSPKTTQGLCKKLRWLLLVHTDRHTQQRAARGAKGIDGTGRAHTRVEPDAQWYETKGQCQWSGDSESVAGSQTKAVDSQPGGEVWLAFHGVEQQAIRQEQAGGGTVFQAMVQRQVLRQTAASFGHGIKGMGLGRGQEEGACAGGHERCLAHSNRF